MRGRLRVARLRARAGFTILEMLIVLAIMTIVSAVVVPEIVSLSANRMLTSTDLVLALLRDSRRLAIQQAATVTVVLDPESGHFRVDTVSALGAGLVTEDTLPLGALDRLETDLPRLRYVFGPTGVAFADSVTIRGSDSTRVILVDPWSGMAYAHAR